MVFFFIALGDPPACQDILGYQITADLGERGPQPGLTVSADRAIAIDAMGEGVPNIVGIIADLCLSSDRVFLIEEPENDLHPRALRGILQLISESAANNQFIISTHSHVVLAVLGTRSDTKVIEVRTA